MNLDLNDLDDFHLGKAIQLLRANKWTEMNERLFGMVLFMLLKLNGVNRKTITKLLRQVDTFMKNFKMSINGI